MRIGSWSIPKLYLPLYGHINDHLNDPVWASNRVSYPAKKSLIYSRRELATSLVLLLNLPFLTSTGIMASDAADGSTVMVRLIIAFLVYGVYLALRTGLAHWDVKLVPDTPDLQFAHQLQLTKDRDSLAAEVKHKTVSLNADRTDEVPEGANVYSIDAAKKSLR